MNASELMTRPLAVVTPSSELSDAVSAMRDTGVYLIPVVDDVKTMRLVGIVTDRFVTARCAARHHAGPCLVGKHMRREPTVAYADEPASDVLERMVQSDMGRLLVVDHLNRVIGIVSQGTLIEDVRVQRTR